MKKAVFVTLWGIVFLALRSPVQAMTPSEYIKAYKADAIEQMLIYNIPASVTLAQGMFESDCGNSLLAIDANNHFGIKCHADWKGPYFIYDDDSCGEHFRVYASVDASYKDHARFLKSRPWYSFLFDYSRTDYRDWAEGLSKAGYATAPDYANQLISIIEEYHLYNLDTVLQNLHGLGVLYGVMPSIGQAAANYVIVKPGDCIYKIAREYKVDIATLCRNNNLVIGDVIVPGEKLYLNDKKSEVNNQPADNKQSSADNKNALSALPAKSPNLQG